MLLLAAVGLIECAAASVLFVSSNASTATSDGSLRRPFTLGQARMALRNKTLNERAGSTIMLRGGDYFILDHFELQQADSGTPERPVVYQSFPGERARIIGGVEIPPAAFKQVAQATGNLLVAELAPLGITNASMLGGAGDVSGLKAELYFDDEGKFAPLQFAQDPNPLANGSWIWTGYDDIVAWGPTWFVFSNTKIVQQGKWCAAVNTTRGLSLFGHWGDMQGIQAIRIKSILPLVAADGTISSYNISLDIDAEATEAFTKQKKSRRHRLADSATVNGIEIKPGVRFVATDALALVDLPGEYWIDRDALRLYYCPVGHQKDTTAGRHLFMSVAPNLASPRASMKHPQALVQIDASWVSFVNVTVGLSTQSLLSASGVEGLTLHGCQFLGAGATCVAIDGAHSTIHQSEISYCGKGGVILSGGNWNKFGSTLFVGANLSIIDTDISHWARWQRVPSNPGISWSGVGHVVRGNVLRDAPEPAVSGDGNVDCVFEQNVIDNVNYEQPDMGAYYHGSSAGGYQFAWTQPGNVIRNNTFSNIRYAERRPTEKDWQFTTQAIYMDDEMSGYTIESNTFINVDVGVLIGGGRNHQVLNNTFESCGTACIHVDNRGMNWAHELCGCQCAFGVCVPGCFQEAAIGPGLAKNFSADDGTFRFEQGMAALHCAGNDPQPPCTEKASLKFLSTLLQDDTGGGPCAPAHNTFDGNTFPSHSGGDAIWQICGDFFNASHYHHACTIKSDPNLAELEAWGSKAAHNTFANRQSKMQPNKQTLPVMPWPVRDHTSPVQFAPWLVNWDIGYYDNSTDLQVALNRSDPDIFEWDFGAEDNRQHELTRKGVLVSSHQSYEWQQTSGASDTTLAFKQNFRNNGYGIDEQGRLETLHPDRGNLSDFMSQMAPKWHALTKEGNLRAVAYGQTITQDNIGNYYGVFHSGGPILPQGRGFSWGPWINSKFVKFYEGKAAGSSLPPLPNGTGFQLTNYVAMQRQLGLSPMDLTRHPILHEYIRFAQNETVSQWVDMRLAAKCQATKESRPFPLGVYGNLQCMAFHPDACGWQQNRMGIMTAQWVDIIVLEATMTVAEFKIAVAAGNFEKPVFPYPDMCGGLCEGPTAVARALGAAPASTSSHAHWYGDNRHIITDRRSVADYAIVLDLPLFFWRGFSSLAVPGNQPHVLAMQNISNLLDEEHIPYDVLFLGHPDFYDDRKHWARISSYRTLILPMVESISDFHVKRIEDFIDEGGRVVVLGDSTGSTDEEDRPRSTNAFDSFRNSKALTWVNSSVFECFLRNSSGHGRNAISTALQINQDPLLATNMSSQVVSAVWLHGNGPMISVAIANADTARKSSLTSLTPHFLSVRVDDHFKSDHELVVTVFSWSLAVASLQVPFESVHGRINITVPPFDRFAALLIGVKGESLVRAGAGLVRKLTERVQLASTVTPGQSVAESVLNASQELLGKIQGPNSNALETSATVNLLAQLSTSEHALRTELQRIDEASVSFNELSRVSVSNNSAIVKVDFSASPVPSPPGWLRVGLETMYNSTAETGVGWINMNTRDQVYASPAPSALVQGKKTVSSLSCPFEDTVLCTYLFSNRSQHATLRIDVPHAGNYTIELVMGEPTAMVTRVALTNLWATGNTDGDELIAIGGRLPVPGEFHRIAFDMSVPPPTVSGQRPCVTFSLGGMAVSQFFQFDDRQDAGRYFNMAWLVSAILIHESHSPISADAADSVNSHRVVAAGVREWSILGPLDDSNATCMSRKTEAEEVLNISGRYTRKGGGVAVWRPVKLQGPLAYLDFMREGISDPDDLGAVSLAVTYAWLKGNSSRRVVLVASNTGVGVGVVNSDEVFRDELNAGLLLNEERVDVDLQPGWNTISIRSCTKWGAQGWGLWMTLVNADGSAVSGIVFSACGPHC